MTLLLMVVVAPLIALLLFLGVYPRPISNIINPAVRDTMSDVHRTDPAPAHPITAAQVAAANSQGGGQ